MDLDNRTFWKHEMYDAEKSGNIGYAKACKEKYRDIIMKSLIKPYHLYIDKLKSFPMIILN